jgi:hypothetical protein
MIKNMNEKLDLIKLLNDCPKGMPLNCTIFDGSVTFNGIVDDDLYPIEIKIDNDYEERLNKYGGYNNSPYCKCVIFPKGKTSWEGFQRPFKDGDILYINCNDDEDTWKDDEDICKNYEYIFILKETTNDDEIHCYCYIDKANENNRFEMCWLTTTKYTPEFATEEEKQMLFDAIKAHGYKWNEETKSLDNLLVPKFNVGDIIRLKIGSQTYKITDVSSEYYSVRTQGHTCVGLPIKDQDNWELVSNVTIPKFKDGDRIRYAGEDFPIKIIDIKNNQYHIECFCDKYNDYKNGIIPISEQNNYMLIPKFNPKTLQPFDRVLVSCNDEWFCDFFSHYDDAVNKFNCTCTGGCPYDYCIPYNDDTKHLIGKSIEDTPEFYKYWE